MCINRRWIVITEENALIKAEDITVTISNKTLVEHISFDLMENDRLMIVGPNGAGKSTLVNAVGQGIPYSGKIYFAGQDIANMKAVERARSIGILSQKYHVSYAFTVEEIVALGRYAYAPNMFSRNKDDHLFVQKALEMTGLREIRNQSVLTLSGGELQRTFLAQLFAQDPKVLILDEPTNHLDLQYQKQIFALVEEWMKDRKKAVIAVVHDLSLASLYGSRFILMHKGRAVSIGRREEVFDSDRLDRIYDMDVRKWMKTLYGQWCE